MAERVCCLYRVSTTRQVDHDELNQADIPMQRKACREFAKKMGWDIVYEEQELGVSGYKISANDRDKIQTIREYALKGKFDILLVFLFDRIGRKSEETPFIVEWFAKNGIRIWSVNEGEQKFESHTDKLTNYIRYWQADGESQKTSIRTKTALSQMVMEGRFRGGIPPYGYKLEKSGILNKRKHEVNKLVIDEEEAQIVRMIFDLCVLSGYGRWKLTQYLNEKGIKNRSGVKWNDASVGHILHNVIYKGVLRSGDTYSEPFEELQIIEPTIFDKAQQLMSERTLEKKDSRTIPLNISGQSLLSGNIFCGHCGGRLVLTTNVKTVTRANGERERIPRVRYICYNKTRKKSPCDGQTGYTMHIVDDIVTDLIHRIFEHIGESSDTELIEVTQNYLLSKLKAELKNTRLKNSRAEKEYDSLKKEIVNAVQGQSKIPMDVLTELVQESRNKISELQEKLAELTARLEAENENCDRLKLELAQVRKWSEIFDASEMAVKKMIAAYIFQRIRIFREYEMEIQINMGVEQFLYGFSKSDIKNTKVV